MSLQPHLLVPALLLLLASHNAAAASLRQLLFRGLLQEDDYVAKLTSGYLSNDELAAYLSDYVKRCSNIAQLSSFGKSAKGVPLLALEISETPGRDSPKPQLKYVANIHGDEPSGRQLLLLLAETLCSQHQQPKTAAHRILKHFRLFIVPTLNPDGFAVKRRENSGPVDLNRNFPDPIQSKGRDLRQPVGREQPETLAMMNFTLQHRFVASLSIHEGAVVANYPFDGYPDGSMEIRRAVNPAPDDAAFRFLATTYADLHTTMHNNPEFLGGITNGAQWYPLYGGMQDWNYLAGGCMELTLELNNDKWPTPQRLAAMWTENKEALLEWPLRTVLAGLQGNVTGIRTDGRTQPLAATISVQGIAYNVTSNAQFGTYYRVLAPGQYTVTVTAEGYQPSTSNVVLPPDLSGATLNWVLEPVGGVSVQTGGGAAGGGGDTAAAVSGGDTQGKGSQTGSASGGGGNAVMTPGGTTTSPAQQTPSTSPAQTLTTPSTQSPTYKKGDLVLVAGQVPQVTGTWLAGSSTTMLFALLLVPLVAAGGYSLWRHRHHAGGLFSSYTQLTQLPRSPQGVASRGRGSAVAEP